MDDPPHEHRPWFRSRSGLVLLAFLGIAGFFLVTEHRAHVFAALPSSRPRPNYRTIAGEERNTRPRACLAVF